MGTKTKNPVVERLTSTFVSYAHARKDKEFTSWLANRLRESKVEVFLDRSHIAGGEAWRERIFKLIGASDAVVFVLSPDFVRSAECAWELREAERLGKRLVPVVAREFESIQAPKSLSRLNYVSFIRPEGTDSEGSLNHEDEFASLISALQHDIAWVREHTELGRRAEEWAAGGRSKSRALQGEILTAAEQLRDTRPQTAPNLTPVMLEFVSRSRELAIRRQREVLIISSMVAIFMLGAAGVAIWQRDEAVDARDETEHTLARLATDTGRQQLLQDHPMTAAVYLSEAYTHDPESRDARLLLPFAMRAVERIHATLVGHSDTVNAVAISHDGRRILSGSSDGTARVWDVRNSSVDRVLDESRKAIRAVAFGPDDARAATGGDDGIIRIWDVETGECLHRFDAKAGRIREVEFTLDGQHLIARHSEEQTMWKMNGDGTPERVSAVVPGASLRRFTLRRIEAGRISVWNNQTRLSHGDFEYQLRTAYRVDPKGLRLLEAGVSGTAKLWDIGEQAEHCLLRGHTLRIHDAVFSEDATRVFTTGEDQLVRMWDAASCKPLMTLQGHTDTVHAIALASDGSWIATGSADHTVRIWDVQPAEARVRIEKAERLNHILSSAEGEFLVVGRRLGDEDYGWSIWSGQTGEEKAHLGMHRALLAVGPLGRRIAMWEEDDTISVWNAGTGTRLAKIAYATTASAAFDTTGTFLAAGVGNTVKIWDTETGKLQYDLGGHESAVAHVAFDPNGNTLVSIDDSGDMLVWDVSFAAERIAQRVKFETGFKRPKALAVSSDGTVAIGSRRKLGLWDVSSGQHLATLQGGNQLITDLAFGSGARILLTHNRSNGILLMWDLKTRSLRRVLNAYGFAEDHGDHRNDRIWAFDVSPDGRYIATGSEKGIINLWDIATDRLLTTLRLREQVTGLAFISDGQTLVASGVQGEAVHWSLTPEARSPSEVAQILSTKTSWILEDGVLSTR